jgi:alpha-methylacyl-CoA racemase
MLNNLKILDFTTLLPGPFGTLLLADLGADIVHISRPNKPAIPLDAYLQRNKKSIVADLKDAHTVEKLKNLVKEYDIVIEQFRPGVMDRLGLGYEALKEINPSIIYCSITGYGQTGPYKNRAGHDINYVALAGIPSHSGSQTGGPPNLGVQIADIAGGSLHAAIAILAAVNHRHITGEGQHIDISMTDCAFTLNAVAATTYFDNGTVPKPESFALNGGSFYGYYETADGRYLSVGSLEPAFRKNLCDAIGKPELLSLSFSEKEEDILAFKEALADEILLKTLDEWLQIFDQVDACVEPVLSLDEVEKHPHFVARGLIVEVENEAGELQKQIACPIKSTCFTPQYQSTGVPVGKDTKDILNQLTI